MHTLSKLSRLWHARRYRALVRDLTRGRPEARLELDTRIGGDLPAAALLLVRLRELNQLETPLAREALERLIWSQNPDGSWPGGVLVSALCVRGLAAARHPTQTRRGLDWLADSSRGIDSAFTAGFVLLQVARLADDIDWQPLTRLDPAYDPAREADAATRWVWQHVHLHAGRRLLPATPTAATDDWPLLAAA
jgi:hypothetical protein